MHMRILTYFPRDGAQVGAAMKSSRAALAAFHDAGGFARVTELLQWTALTFAGTKLAGSNGLRGEGLGEDGDDPSSSAALRSSGVTSTSAPGTVPAHRQHVAQTHGRLSNAS